MHAVAPWTTCARGAAASHEHRAAFVGLDVAEADEAQLIDREEPGDRL